MLEIIVSAVVIWPAALKTREHFKKYPLRKDTPPQVESSSPVELAVT
ncbi:hypothetical protein CENDO_07910 [Corynebacterium endometrii]|uniref:Uncharacterized protein n=1 Tax=Corynebacterium endometrii TaxID=2488819 RepID=A0A4P7QIE5_9CORY|nr:hypothetical protein CENDO_07910 [Corynebacterium endometrii]